MCVNMYLRKCGMIACVRLKLDLRERGCHLIIRYVTQGGGKTEILVESLLRRGRGPKMTEISVT